MWTGTFYSTAEPGAPSIVWFFIGASALLVLGVGLMIGYRSTIVKWVFGSLLVLAYALSIIGVVRTENIQHAGMDQMTADASRQFGVPLTITATPPKSDYFYLATTGSGPQADCSIDYEQHVVQRGGYYMVNISCNGALTRAAR